MIVYHDRHNRQEINNSIQVENHRIQTNVRDLYIDHECHLNATKIINKYQSCSFLKNYHKFLMELQVRVESVD